MAAWKSWIGCLLVENFNAFFSESIEEEFSGSLYSAGRKTSGDLPGSLGFMAICLEDEIRRCEYNTE